MPFVPAAARKGSAASRRTRARSSAAGWTCRRPASIAAMSRRSPTSRFIPAVERWMPSPRSRIRSEEHTSELQSPCNLVCRLLLEKKERLLRASDVGPEFPTRLGDLLDATNGDWAAIRRTALKAGNLIAERGRRLDEAVLLPPIPHPSKIVAIGLNYRDHAVEAGAPTPTQPTMFAKFPSSLIGHGSEISWDPALTNEVDYEAELAVVIGRRAKSVSEENALDYVFGYTCANDVSARDLQFAE